MGENKSAEWLTGLLLGAAELIPVKDRMKVIGQLRTPDGNVYQIGPKVGSSESFNIYQCILSSGKCGVLKIALTTDHNASLDREALTLLTMRRFSDELEAKNVSYPYNYHHFFPERIDSFICPEQGNRRVNVLGLSELVEEFGQLEPLSFLIDRDRLRVDPKTAAWMIGKNLKVLLFAHDQRIITNGVTTNNILYDRDKHGVIIFDWTLAELVIGKHVPVGKQRQEIAAVGRIAIDILGGDRTTGYLPKSDQLPNDRFERYIWKMAQGQVDDAFEAHNHFYEIIRGNWPERDFHPFTTYPR